MNTQTIVAGLILFFIIIPAYVGILSASVFVGKFCAIALLRSKIYKEADNYGKEEKGI